MSKVPCIYIMSNKKNGTLYVGVTSNLPNRVYQHKNRVVESFTRKYALHKLVYYEVYDSMYNAICREKQLKNWQRKWKIELIEGLNPSWKDLYSTIL